MTSNGFQETLVIFDFDHTVVNDNTDTFVFKVLDPTGELNKQQLARHTGKEQWTDMCHRLLGELHARGTGDRASIAKAMAAIEMPAEMQQIFRLLHAQDNTCIRIVSDANTVYIDQCLRAYNVDQCIDKVVTNPADWGEDERLSVSRYVSADAPHGCERCPINLCKGKVLDAWATGKTTRRVYVGDGSNDYCPSTRLGPNDVVFARSGFALTKLINAKPVIARTRFWSTHDELLAAMLEEGVITAAASETKAASVTHADVATPAAEPVGV